MFGGMSLGVWAYRVCPIFWYMLFLDGLVLGPLVSLLLANNLHNHK